MSKFVSFNEFKPKVGQIVEIIFGDNYLKFSDYPERIIGLVVETNGEHSSSKMLIAHNCSKLDGGSRGVERPHWLKYSWNGNWNTCKIRKIRKPKDMDIREFF